MASGAYPVLCGGTFFTLVLEAHKPRSGKKEQLYGKRDGLSEPETLAGLIRVMYPEFKEPSSGRTFKTNTSDYKRCRNNGGNLPFFDKEIKTFDNRIKNDYQTALAQMSGFVDRFIEVGGSVKRDKWLVKALLDLIERDKSIKDNDKFYVCENGEPLTKSALYDFTEFSLPAFLLGVWHFSVVCRQNNTAGKDTFEDWCPPNNRNPRVYTGHMGESITRAISVTVPALGDVAEDDGNSADTEDEPSEECSEPNAKDTAGNASAKATNQIVNNPFVFNQYGNNNVQIASIDKLTINNG